MPPASRNNQDAIYQQLITEFSETYTEVANFRAELKALKESIEPIVKIVRGDGTSPTVLTQVALIEQNFQYLNAAHEENRDKLSELSKTIDDMKSADKHGRWQLIVAVVAGLIGFLTAVVQAVFQAAK